MWTLVFIYLYAGEPYAVKYDTYDDMVTCFKQREILGKKQTGRPGYFESGTQALCIYEEKDSV